MAVLVRAERRTPTERVLGWLLDAAAVEFAVVEHASGKTLHDAVVEAARLRFRPILMTSFAFILGVMPLVLSSGAGANARHAIGTGVAGGMITAAVLGVLFVPLAFGSKITSVSGRPS